VVARTWQQGIHQFPMGGRNHKEKKTAIQEATWARDKGEKESNMALSSESGDVLTPKIKKAKTGFQPKIGKT